MNNEPHHSRYELRNNRWDAQQNQSNTTSTFIIDPDDPERVTSETRKLGLVVIRGTQVSLVSPEEGTEEIANPFLGGEEEEEEEEEEE